MDRKEIEAAAAWWDRIRRGIEAAKALIFVVSPESVVSVDCGHELDVALDSHKRIIPVVFRDVEAASLRRELSDLNWIFFRDSDDGSAATEQIIMALEDDLEWRDWHTRIGVRTTEWFGAGEDSSFLIRGADLRQAEDRYAEESGHAERLTDAQIRYIHASRRAATTRQRRLVTGIAVGLVLSIVLSVIAVVKSVQATAAAHRAESVSIATESGEMLANNIPRAMLLAIEARARADTPQAAAALSAAAMTPWSSIADRGTIVPTVTFSSDGEWMASGNVSGRVTLTRATGQTIRLSAGSPVASLAFSPDSKLLAVPERSGVHLYHLDSRVWTTVPLPAGDAPGQIYSVAFDPGGDTLVTGDVYAHVILYNLETGDAATISDPGLLVYTTAFSPDGRSLAWGDNLGDVVVRDVASGTDRTIADDLGSQIASVAFSPDSKSIAIGDESGRVVQVDLANGATTTRRDSDGVSVNSVRYSPDGAILASGDGRGRVVLENVATAATTALADGGVPVYSLAFSPDGKVLAAGGGHGFASDLNSNVYRAEGAGSVVLFDMTKSLFNGSAVESLAYSGDGRLLAGADAGGQVYLYDRRSGRTSTLVDPACQDPPTCDGTYGSQVWTVSFSPDSQSLASGDTNGAIVVYHRGGDDQEFHDPRGAGILSLSFNRSGSSIAYGTSDGRVVLFALKPFGASMTLLHTSPTGNESVKAVVFSPNETTLAAVIGNGTIDLLHRHGGTYRLSKTLREVGSPDSAAFSPDGALLAVGDANGLLTVHDLSTGAAKTVTVGNKVNAVTFSRNGELIAAGDGSGQAVLFDRGGSRLAVLNSADGSGIDSVAISPDGKVLSMGTESGEILSTTTATGLELGPTLCRRIADQNLTRAEWNTYVPGQSYHATCPSK